MSLHDRIAARAAKEEWKMRLEAMSNKDVVLEAARNMLPETTGEALIETGLAAATGVGTYVFVGALTPALLAAGGAVAAVAAYNLKTKSDGEVKELIGRLRKWTFKSKEEKGDGAPPKRNEEVVHLEEVLKKTVTQMDNMRAYQDEQGELINSLKCELNLSKHQMAELNRTIIQRDQDMIVARQELAKALKCDEVIEVKEPVLECLNVLRLEEPEPKVIVDQDVDVSDFEVLETEDPENLDVAQWVKEGK
jgi:hypothetical protein